MTCKPQEVSLKAPCSLPNALPSAGKEEHDHSSAKTRPTGTSTVRKEGRACDMASGSACDSGSWAFTVPDLGKRKVRRQMFATQAWLLSTSSELLPVWLMHWQERKGIGNQEQNSKASMLKRTKSFLSGNPLLWPPWSPHAVLKNISGK